MMRQLLIQLVYGIAFCSASLSALAEMPSRIQAHYDLSGNGFKIATVTETFIRTGDHYHLESISKAFGFVAMFKPETIHAISEGLLTEQGLRPLNYSQERKLDKEKNAMAKFDWAQAMLSLKDRDGQREVALPVNAQDRLSAMYQFQFLPMHETREVKFSLADGNKIDEYFYTVTPGQSIKVPMGVCDAYYLVTRPQPDGWKSEVWLRNQDRLACKVILTDSNGDRFIQVLTALTIEP